MSGKLLLLLGAALMGSLLLVMILGVQRELEEPTVVLVSTGRLLLKQGDAVVLDEAYALEFDPEAGYLLNSLTDLLVDGRVEALAQQSRYDEAFRPLEYQLVAQTADGTTLVSAYLTERGLEMSVQDGEGMHQAVAEAAAARLALLDRNVMAQYVVLLHAIRAEALDRTFTAAVPQALQSTRCHVEGPYTVSFVANGEVRQGKQFRLYMDEAEIRLIVEDGQLIGLTDEARGVVGYDAMRYPEGISLRLPGSEESSARRAMAERHGTVGQGMSCI
ncbi:MAG TPA: hypothetical protein ENN96_00285 [Candidatus Acetothermia bacterium]|nr:hypothetical protein [Candidatus Acetothermia bacterium]